MDSDYSFKCPKCDNFGFLYSKEETVKTIKSHFKNRSKEFLDNIGNYDLEEILYRLNRQRNFLDSAKFFYDYFSLTFGIGVILKNWNKINRTNKRSVTPISLEEIKLSSNLLYLDIHHLYFTKFDAIRKINLTESNKTNMKYTENWTPIFKRCLLGGSQPKEPDFFASKFGMNLFSGLWYRKIFLEDLHNKYNYFANITLNLDFLYNYLFHYPWGDYLKIGRDPKQVDFFLKMTKEIDKREIYTKNDRILLKKEYRTYITDKWLSKIDNSTSFPIIFELNNKWYVPTTFFRKMRDISGLFSSKNRKKFGEYQEKIGKTLENRVFHDLNCYNLDLTSPISNKIFLRFNDPQISNEELMDVGALDHKNKLFYIIECKNKSRIELRNYNPLNLFNYIKREFEEFKNRDLPRIEQLKIKWKLKNYKTVPMFFNFIPLHGEFEHIEQFMKLDGIYVIQNFAEIGAIILHNFHKNNTSFYEIYRIPKKFRKVICNDLDINVNYHVPQDIGYLLGEDDEKYIIELGTVKSITIGKNMTDIDIKLDGQINIISMDIPPELHQIFKNKEIKEGDKVSTLFYRISPYSQVIILGKIWKL